MRFKVVPLLGALMVLGLTLPGLAQPLTDRTPLLEGTRMPLPHTLFFTFEHWFSLTGPPVYKVVNSPTFDLAYGLGKWEAGLRYETNSQIVPGVANAFEPYLRSRIVSQRHWPFALAAQVAYDTASNSGDGEALFERQQGAVDSFLALRGMSDGYGLGQQGAVGVGINWHFLPHLTLQGDLTKVVTLASSPVAWSAAVAADIPGTPHTLALEATNAIGDTLEGSSMGSSAIRYGFAFTIPFVSRERYLSLLQRQSLPTPVPAGSPSPQASTVLATHHASVTIDNYAFHPDILHVHPGTLVIWQNHDAVVHTATSMNQGWTTGFIAPGQQGSHLFITPGSYRYYCSIHPWMSGSVIVDKD